MAKGVNMVVLLGNVGKDPEIRTTQGGTTIATVSLATPERRKQGDEWVDHTEWHNLVAFGRTAEIMRDYVTKGSKLHIIGRIQTRSWDDKDSGQKKYRTEIIIDDLSLLGAPNSDGGGSRGGGGQSSGGSRQQQSNGYAQQSRTQPDYGDQGITDEDIPF